MGYNSTSIQARYIIHTNEMLLPVNSNIIHINIRQNHWMFAGRGEVLNSKI